MEFARYTRLRASPRHGGAGGFTIILALKKSWENCPGVLLGCGNLCLCPREGIYKEFDGPLEVDAKFSPETGER